MKNIPQLNICTVIAGAVHTESYLALALNVNTAIDSQAELIEFYFQMKILQTYTGVT